MKRIKRLLVVDDNPGDLLLAELAFEDVADAIHSEDDGAEALAHLERCAADQLPTLVLLDINMPRMNGMQVLEQIAQAPSDRRPPVILMLGEALLPDQRARAIALGVAGWLPKPPTEEVARELAERFG